VAKGHLTGAFVFGEIAAEGAARFAASQTAPKLNPEQVAEVEKKIERRTARADKRVDVQDIEYKVRRLINDYLTSPKNPYKLNRWLEWAHVFERELEEDVAARNGHELLKTFEVGNIVKCATFSAVAALERKESRNGYSHQRNDFPQQDDKNWLCHVDVHRSKDGSMTAGKRPLNRNLPGGGAL
jgi:succinate dehydrogenase/fumarate reductase flavoprotein subunit